MNLAMAYLQGNFPCIFKTITGLYCPGCGGTRAVFSLLHGRVVQSFVYHPLVLYCAVVFAVFAASWGLFFLTGKEKFRLQLNNRYIHAAVAVTAVNFLIKNFILLFYGFDVLEWAAGLYC